MYGPISIIVEGATEATSLTRIIKKLAEAGIEDFVDAPQILEQYCFILCATGDNYPYWVTIVKSQGSTPILFLDGDKAKQVKTADVKAKLGDCPIVLLDEGEEFENLIPTHIYFEALKEQLKREDISLSAFESWKQSSTNKNIPRYMFSKQVEKWVDELDSDLHINKPNVFFEAIQKADASKN